MICSKCGKQLPDTADYCVNCGSRVGMSEVAVKQEDYTDIKVSLVMILAGWVTMFLPVVHVTEEYAYKAYISSGGDLDLESAKDFELALPLHFFFTEHILAAIIYFALVILSVITGYIAIKRLKDIKMRTFNERSKCKFWQMSCTSSISIFIANILGIFSAEKASIEVYGEVINCFDVASFIYSFMAVVFINGILAYIKFSKAKDA